jgi:hypothetical protein
LLLHFCFLLSLLKDKSKSKIEMKNMLVFIFSVVGSQKLVFNLKNVPIHDGGGFWPQVSQYSCQILYEQFSSQGTRGPGSSWAPPTPPSLARKAKKYGPGKPILRASGDLRGSLVFETAGGGGTIGEHPTAGQARMIGQAAYEADLGAAL